MPSYTKKDERPDFWRMASRTSFFAALPLIGWMCSAAGFRTAVDDAERHVFGCRLMAARAC